MIGDALHVVENLPSWLMVTLLIAFVTFFTEVTSNTAVMVLVIPIFIAMV